MADYLIQEKEQPLRSGYFNRDAFREKRRSILVLQTAVAGLKFHIDDNSDDGRELLKSLTPGTELFLYRDADNEYDKWAVSVCTCENRELGHITRFKNETIARLMDYGKVFRAFVDEPPELSQDEDRAQARKKRTPTEDFKLPFSIYMDD